MRMRKLELYWLNMVSVVFREVYTLAMMKIWLGYFKLFKHCVRALGCRFLCEIFGLLEWSNGPILLKS